MKQIILLFACLFALQGLAKADDDRAITVDQLPQKAQEFIPKYFPKNEISLAKMEKDFWEKKYEVVFVNGEKAEFLKDGSWEKVDCKYSTVPPGIEPFASVYSNSLSDCTFFALSFMKTIELALR